MPLADTNDIKEKHASPSRTAADDATGVRSPLEDAFPNNPLAVAMTEIQRQCEYPPLPEGKHRSCQPPSGCVGLASTWQTHSQELEEDLETSEAPRNDNKRCQKSKPTPQAPMLGSDEETTADTDLTESEIADLSAASARGEVGDGGGAVSPLSSVAKSSFWSNASASSRSDRAAAAAADINDDVGGGPANISDSSTIETGKSEEGSRGGSLRSVDDYAGSTEEFAAGSPASSVSGDVGRSMVVPGVSSAIAGAETLESAAMASEEAAEQDSHNAAEASISLKPAPRIRPPLCPNLPNESGLVSSVNDPPRLGPSHGHDVGSVGSSLKSFCSASSRGSSRKIHPVDSATATSPSKVILNFKPYEAPHKAQLENLKLPLGGGELSDSYRGGDDMFHDDRSLHLDKRKSSSSGGTAHRGNLMRNASTSCRRTSGAVSPDNLAPTGMLTEEDIEICMKLDAEYEKALEEREVGWEARYNSVRQSACFSLTFMFLYLLMGTLFFDRHTDWALNDSLLFTIYTITTVGYGNHEIPSDPGFQTFVIFFIFVGIATLTIMVAQVYQCIALEATRAQYSRDKAEIARRGVEVLETHRRTSLRAVHAEAEANMPGGEDKKAAGSNQGTARLSMSSIMEDFRDAMVDYRSCWDKTLDVSVLMFEQVKHFLKFNQIGRGISVLLPFAGLILIGAIVVGPIEGWTFIESLYFSVVSLTTVGFGDYHPTQNSSIWFCIFWLPFSVGFMSLYLGSVAHFYIRLSNHNIQRLERQMRRRMRKAKAEAEREKEMVRRRARKGQGSTIAFGGDEKPPKPPASSTAQDPPTSLTSGVAPASRKHRGQGFNALSTLEIDDDDIGREGAGQTTAAPALFGSADADAVSVPTNRREQILKNSSLSAVEGGSEGPIARPKGKTMTTMKAVLRAVKVNNRDAIPCRARGSFASSMPVFPTDTKDSLYGPEAHFMSVRSTSALDTGVSSRKRRLADKKPTFALRVLVQERMAEIIATDIAGFQSRVEIKENTLSVTINTLKATADKWSVPRRARKAFRAVAFESLYFVGEHGLITRGADALYDLTPFEFHGLFGPLVAAMGDADTMEGWLAKTNVLADVDLRRDSTRPKLAAHALATRSLGSDGGADVKPKTSQTGKSAGQTGKFEEVKDRHARNCLENASGPNHMLRQTVVGNAFSSKNKGSFNSFGA